MSHFVPVVLSDMLHENVERIEECKCWRLKEILPRNHFESALADVGPHIRVDVLNRERPDPDSLDDLGAVDRQHQLIEGLDVMSGLEHYFLNVDTRRDDHKCVDGLDHSAQEPQEGRTVPAGLFEPVNLQRAKHDDVESRRVQSVEVVEGARV